MAKVELDRLTVRFGDVTAVDAISLSGQEMRVLREVLRKKLSLEDVTAALPAPGPTFTKREMEEFKEKLRGLGVE